jgi:DNA-binding MarR family transcriptional regulator
MARSPIPKDAVDEMVAAAGETWPDADALAHSVVARLIRLLSLVYSDLEAVAADFGISISALEALAALRLAPPPHRLSQRALGEVLMRTSGTLSIRLAGLEREGFITRVPDHYDARAVTVELTACGRTLIDQAMTARFEAEKKLLSGVSRAELQQLAALLRNLLVPLERREAGPRLGIELAPRRAAKVLRRAHEIADGVGLLVASVDDGSPADRAGIATGDLIIRLDGRQLRSAAQLKRAVLAQGDPGKLDLAVMRNGEELAVTVAIADPVKLQ